MGHSPTPRGDPLKGITFYSRGYIVEWLLSNALLGKGKAPFLLHLPSKES